MSGVRRLAPHRRGMQTVFWRWSGEKAGLSPRNWCWWMPFIMGLSGLPQTLTIMSSVSGSTIIWTHFVYMFVHQVRSRKQGLCHIHKSLATQFVKSLRAREVYVSINQASIDSANGLSSQCSATTHYMNQCWVVAIWVIGNKFQQYFNQTTTTYIQ